MTVRVRFAPSPTGFLHVGGARTALFNWLWARHNKGTFILRIEDTDVERSTYASTEQILESLQWLGIDWDEGPIFQSDRWDVYNEHLQRLINGGHVYRCFCSTERLDAMRLQAQVEKRNPIYDRTCLGLGPAEVRAKLDAGTPFVWRFKCPPGVTDVPETLRSGASDCRFDNETLGDFAITRAGTEQEWGKPLYNFCCAVDDADMGITNVIRGNEHLSNTPRQMLISEALGFRVPSYTHLPLILKNNKKMSKRDGDADPRFPVSVSARRDLGYLKEATVNFIALLGWSFDDRAEFFTLDELVEKFALDKLSKANANFDEDKYLHMNGWYMRNLPREEIVSRVKPFLERAGLDASGREDGWLAQIIGLEIERCRLLGDFPEALRYFFEAPASYEEKAAKKIFLKEGVAEALRAVAAVLDSATYTSEALDTALRGLAESRGVGFGNVAQPVRLAVTGRSASPGLYDVLLGIGREESVRRIRQAAERIEANQVALA